MSDLEVPTSEDADITPPSWSPLSDVKPSHEDFEEDLGDGDGISGNAESLLPTASSRGATSEERNSSTPEEKTVESPKKRLQQSPDILSACGLKRARRNEHRNESHVDDKIAQGLYNYVKKYKKEQTSAAKANSSRKRKGRKVQTPAKARASVGKLEVVDIEYMPTGTPIEVPLRPPKTRKKRTRTPLKSKAASTSQVHKLEVITLTSNGGSEVRELEVVPLKSNGTSEVRELKIIPSDVPQSDARSTIGSLKDVEIEFLNFGSDMDSDEEEGETLTVPTGISRTANILLDTPMDPEPPVPPLPGTEWSTDPMYDFKWLPYPDPPVPPESRREPFTAANVGPTVPNMSPVELFKYIWDAEIMGTIVTETNKYAQQLMDRMIQSNRLRPNSRIREWKDTTADELFIFFGINLAMGVVIKSRLVDYWNVSNDIFATPGFRAKMSLRRYQLLFACLHFNDNSQIPEDIDTAEARLYKIQPVLDHVNRKFGTMYNMGQNISLDESLLQWRGWLQICQLIPNKAATVGIKTYEVCESQTGYLWRFLVHAGSGTRPEASQDPLSAFTPSLVLKLLAGLEHKGYTVWMDSFYNSPILARKLKQLGFDCVGTLRTNRQFVPAEINNLQKSDMKQGQITGVTSGDVDLLVWRDQNRVATISTYHGNAVSTDKEGNVKPILIRDYNIMMGGVDKKDQLLSSYPVERKRFRVWYKKLFKRLLNVSVLNAYIIHKSRNNIDHLDFRKQLTLALLKEGSIATASNSVSNQFDLRHHYLKSNGFGAQSSKGRKRRKCRVCHQLTSMYCVGCEKASCLDCFRQLHL